MAAFLAVLAALCTLLLEWLRTVLGRASTQQPDNNVNECSNMRNSAPLPPADWHEDLEQNAAEDSPPSCRKNKSGRYGVPTDAEDDSAGQHPRQQQQPRQQQPKGNKPRSSGRFGIPADDVVQRHDIPYIPPAVAAATAFLQRQQQQPAADTQGSEFDDPVLPGEPRWEATPSAGVAPQQAREQGVPLLDAQPDAPQEAHLAEPVTATPTEATGERPRHPASHKRPHGDGEAFERPSRRRVTFAADTHRSRSPVDARSQPGSAAASSSPPVPTQATLRTPRRPCAPLPPDGSPVPQQRGKRPRAPDVQLPEPPAQRTGSLSRIMSGLADLLTQQTAARTARAVKLSGPGPSQTTRATTSNLLPLKRAPPAQVILDREIPRPRRKRRRKASKPAPTPANANAFACAAAAANERRPSPRALPTTQATKPPAAPRRPLEQTSAGISRALGVDAVRWREVEPSQPTRTPCNSGYCLAQVQPCVTMPQRH